MNLYKINDGFIQLEQISRKIEEMEEAVENPVLIDEMKEQLKKEFETAGELLSEKLDNVMYMLINSEAEIKALKAESERLSKKAKSKEKQIDYIKRTLIKEALENTETGKHKSLVGSLYTMNTQAVEITDCNIIPADFKKEVIEVKIDKKGIKDKLKAGEKITGAYLKENKSVVFRK